MNAQLWVIVACVVITAGLYFRDRHLKAKVRGCRYCGSTNVERIFKMYPIVGHATSGQGILSATPLVVLDSRSAFTVYKFCGCLHCGRFAMVESYDKRFTLPSLRHKVHREPEVFIHNADLFKRANLTPCKTLNLEFNPQILGDATLEERYLGFRLPWRSELRQVSFG